MRLLTTSASIAVLIERFFGNLVNENMKKMSVKAVKCHLKYIRDHSLRLHCSQLKINMPQTDARDVFQVTSVS